MEGGGRREIRHCGKQRSARWERESRVVLGRRGAAAVSSVIQFGFDSVEWPKMRISSYLPKLSDHMKVKENEDQSVGASVLLGGSNKIIKGSRGWYGLGRRREWGEEKRGQDLV